MYVRIRSVTLVSVGVEGAGVPAAGNLMKTCRVLPLPTSLAGLGDLVVSSCPWTKESAPTPANVQPSLAWSVTSAVYALSAKRPLSVCVPLSSYVQTTNPMYWGPAKDRTGVPPVTGAGTLKVRARSVTTGVLPVAG